MLSQLQDTMEVTALCFRLLMLKFILLRAHGQTSYTQEKAFLRITPNKLQHFQFDSVSFECVGFGGLTHLRGMKNAEEFSPTCDINRTPAPFCTMDRAYAEDSGIYWCESDGERSQRVNITVTAGSVILDIPALPVIEGNDVTLRCSGKKTYTNLTIFYKDDFLIQSSPAEEIRISNVSKSDEGLYKCDISSVGTSQGSWLAVRANTIYDTSTLPHEGPLSHGSESPNVLILLCVAVTILMLILVLLVIGFLHVRKQRELVKGQKAASSSVNREGGADESSGVTYAVVVTKHRKEKDATDAGDNLSLCLKTNQSKKPQTEKEEDGSSDQLVYAAVTITSRLSSSKLILNSTADKDPGLTEEEMLYSPIVHKAARSRDT